jgi:flavin reductase (DIM6/NTAB) family NADH-FMN oxidoreductase RutF
VIHDSGHAFRRAAGRFASGVTVVTTRASQGHYGMTVSSFASLSLNPLLVTVSINRSSPLLGYVRSAEAFAVSVLSSDQEQVAAYFAT